MTWAPIVLFASLVGLLVGGWLFIQRVEQNTLRTRLAVTARLVAVRLEDYLAAQLEHVTQLGDRIEGLGGVDADEFRRLSAAQQDRASCFQALNWVDAGGVIRIVVPEEANRGALGYDLRRHPVAASAFREAEGSDRATVTPPLELLQGGWGFATYSRVRRDGRTLGFLNGVFRVDTLLARCIQRPEDEQLGYFLHDEERLVGVHGVRFDERQDAPKASHRLRIADREWRLTVVPTPRLAAAEETWADEALLLVGIALAAALTWMAEIARAKHHRVNVLAERFRVVIEHAPDAIVVFDAETGCFIDENENARRLFGRTREEMARIGFRELSPARQPDGRDSGEASRELVDRTLAGEAPGCEWTHVGADGEPIVTETRLVRLPSEGRELVRGSITDITARRRLEGRLQRGQAMEAMGRLAGGVAHDFNNVLTGIMGASELLAAQLAGDASGSKLATEISEACSRAADLTRQLLAFSRGDVVKRVPLDLNEIVERLLPMLRRTLGEHVEVVTRLAPSLDAVVIDASQLELVILNLAINGRDAMPNGGRLTIGTSMLEPAPAVPSAPEPNADPSARRVILTVQDEGEGIAPENVSRIFEPFFTTKTPTVGTGLGLATVKQVVCEAGGDVRVESGPGEGATFVVELPAVADKAREIDGAAAVLDVSPGKGTVLVVEDDDDVRAVTRRALLHAGYRVLEARDGESALELAGAYEGPIDLLLTDVVLPGIKGPEVAVRLAASRGETAILLMSGYSNGELHEPLVTGDVELLRKPFTPSALRRRVAEVLNARPSAGKDDASREGPRHVSS